MSEVIAGYLTDHVKITKVADHTAAGTTTIESSSIDMLGFDGVVFLTSYGTAAANNTATVEHSDASGSGFAATVALKTSGTSDEDVAVDVQVPQKRYVRLSAARGTSSTLESVWAIQYRGRSVPQTFAVTGTSAVGQFNSPAAA